MKRKPVIIMLLITAFSVFYFLSCKESSVVAGFPVPVMAELTKEDETGMFEVYDWWRASEENGLPLSYLAMIRLWGWKEADVMGTMTTYEKDGRKVDVVSQTRYLSISEPSAARDRDSPPSKVAVDEWGSMPYKGKYYLYFVLGIKSADKDIASLESIDLGVENVSFEQFIINYTPSDDPEVWQGKDRLDVPVKTEAGSEYRIIISSEDSGIFEAMEQHGLTIHFNNYVYEVN
ncbi:hypothetical protein MM300_00750 [Evansella sp. LMS18]|uniref:hypothetical protein n=1 Tax=Evansella sp. LMS18 TaxID=2924033 RepID=UPI0020D12D39|nr:hypothetical protein [Evansella sp. LMS18]UTR10901.1 hypothetical protein MM300_00750 [Evansella sp. LMS18]